ncbi:hypothetical protein [Hallella bergensis]|nr:hypothetical protein [Hallella bergensis]
MKKNYVRPRADIIYTNVENALLAGSGDGDATTPPIGGGGSKPYSGDFDDFTDESLWGDETDGNN